MLTNSKRAARIARNRSGIDKRLEAVRGVLDSGVSDARVRANNAQNSANTAQSSANTAQSSANSAQNSANNAQSSANSAQTSANGAQTRADNAYDRTVNIARAQLQGNIIDSDKLLSGATDNLRAVAGAHMKDALLARRHFGFKVVPFAAMSDNSVGVNNIINGHVTRPKYAKNSVGADATDFSELYVVLDTRYALR